MLYGGKCACCGETNPVFLALDHIKGDGGNHRKVRTRDGILRDAFYRPDSERYRILCHNCNMAYASFGTCPHVDPDFVLPEDKIEVITQASGHARYKKVG